MKSTKRKIFYLLIYFLWLIAFSSFAQQKEKVGIEQKLGNYLPLNLHFINSNGDTVALKNIITKPTLLAIVYYECPGLCAPMQSELAWNVDNIQLEPGKDFQVISISFDHHETPRVATIWKRNYLQMIKRKFSTDDWLFLTGDSLSVAKLTDACGFYFKPAEKQFVHASTVIAISPQGKISRYLFGPDFNPFDLKMALLEAESGKSNPAITKVLQYCFSYDPAGRKYTLDITRIAGTIILIGLGIFVGLLLLKKKKVNLTTGG